MLCSKPTVFHIHKYTLLILSAVRFYYYLYNAYISGLAGFVASMVFVNIITPMYFAFLYSALIMKLGVIASINKNDDIVPADKILEELTKLTLYTSVRLK